MAGNRMTARQFLAKEIRRAREATGKNGMSRASLAKGMFISDSLIAKWESGRQVPKDDQMQGLLSRLTFPSTEVLVQRMLEELVNGEVGPEWSGIWLSNEQKASDLRSYDLFAVNGLLQTPDYARAVLGYNRHAREDLDARLQSRLERQQVLELDEPPMAIFIFDEFALRRRVGSDQVMANQMTRILDLAQRPNIIIQVIESGTEYYSGCPFTMAKLDGIELAFIDDVLSGRIIEDPEEIDSVSRIWESIRAEARPQVESLELIERAAESWNT